jgi:hypothetical protein
MVSRLEIRTVVEPERSCGPNSKFSERLYTKDEPWRGAGFNRMYQAPLLAWARPCALFPQPSPRRLGSARARRLEIPPLGPRYIRALARSLTGIATTRLPGGTDGIANDLGRMSGGSDDGYNPRISG